MIRLSFELQVSRKSQCYVNRTEESFYSRADRGGVEMRRNGVEAFYMFIFLDITIFLKFSKI